MQIVNIQQIQFTIASGASSGTGTLSGFTSNSKMVCFASWRMDDEIFSVKGDQIEIDVWPNSTTQITAQRWGTPSLAVTIRAMVIEFGNDTTVYKGTWAMTSSETSDPGGVSIGGTVTLANTFGWHYRESEGEASPSTDSDPDGRFTRMTFTSTTALGFTRNAAKGACEGHWFVVESSSASVQHSTHSVSSSSATSVTDAITSVTTADTFLLGSFETNEPEFNDEGTWAMDLQNSTTVRFRRGYGGGEDTTWYHMAVEDSALTVQRGDFTHTATTGNATITAVDLDLATAHLSMVKSGSSSSTDWQAGWLDSRYHETWLSSTTQINAQTGDAPANNTLPWEVVEWPLQTARNRFKVIS